MIKGKYVLTLLEIRDYYENYRSYPSFEELKEKCNLGSKATVRSHLQELKKHNLINYEENRCRTLTITTNGFNFIECIRGFK